MKLSKMSKVDLELLSYTDLTEMILNENKKAMNTPAIFKIICELLEYSDEEYAAKIGDYYTSLTIDKRFVLLDSAEWDLKQKYVIPLEVEDDEEEIEEDFEEEIEEDEEIDDEADEEEEDIDDVDDDALDDDDDIDDDMEDLAIIDEDEESDDFEEEEEES